MVVFGRSARSRNHLKTLELVSGFEPLTYALRMRTQTNREVIDMFVIDETGTDYRTVTMSNQLPFVL